MRRFAIIALSAFLLLCSCSAPADKEFSPLFHTVPSRSLVVARFGHLEHGLGLLLDTTSVFRSLDYGRLGNEEAILSYDFGAALIPLLSIDAGKASADTSSAVARLLAQASGKGLYAFYTADLLAKRAAVLLSTSLTAIREAEEHIRAGVSVMDAHGFSDALSLCGGSALSVIQKNSSCSRWLPADFLRKNVARRDLNSFVAGVSEWTVLDFDSYSFDRVALRFGNDGSKRYLSEMFAGLAAEECKAGAAVPAASDFVLGVAMKDVKLYSDAWQECLDVRADLSKYNGRLAGLRKRCGKNPLVWMKEKDIREIVVARWDGREVQLVRGSSKVRKSEPSDNPYPGFVPALFGDAFRIADESCCASAAGWTAIGSSEDVSAWLEALPDRDSAFTGIPRTAKCYFINDEFSIVADNKKTELHVN